METEAAFVFFSAGIALMLELMKKLIPSLEDSRLMPVIPMLIGMALCPFLIKQFQADATLGWSFFVGFMAGALSTSCYEIVYIFLDSIAASKRNG
jgi:hypothetical protein